jgi:hypothetical protein
MRTTAQILRRLTCYVGWTRAHSPHAVCGLLNHLLLQQTHDHVFVLSCDNL